MSQATVSMALANNPRVSPETREAVRAAAERLTYRPDPALRSLARYRKAGATAAFHGTLAWVHSWASAEAWRGAAAFDAMFRAAEQRADKMGYKLENFWFDSSELTPLRATNILAARGIQGLLLPQYSHPDRKVTLDWKEFSVVRLAGYPVDEPIFHLLASDHYASFQTVMEQLAARGYRRPGLVTSRALERRLMHSYVSAYAGRDLLRKDHGARTAPVLWHEGLNAEGFKRWLKGHSVDVLVLSYAQDHYGRIFDWLHAAGLKVPDDIGVAMLCLPDFTRPRPARLPEELCGIDEDFAELGDRAAELLIQTLENFERGVPARPMRKLLAGVWREGRTLRPQ